MRSGKTGLFALALLLAGVLLAGAAFAEPPRSAKAFTALPAKKIVTLTGFTRPRAELEIISEVAGRCLKVNAQVGQAIAKSGVFAVLDATFVRLEIRANQVEQKRLASRVAYLKKEVARRRVLVLRRSAPQAQLDQLQQELDQADLRLEGLKVQALTLRERRARHMVKAPPGWLVTARAVEPGQWVAAGAKLGKAGDFGKLLVPLALTREEYQGLGKMRQPFMLSIAGQKQKVPARIDKVNPDFDPATRKIKLDLVIENCPGCMRGGLRAQLSLLLEEPAGVVLVPAGALEQRYQEQWLTLKGGGQIRVIYLGPGPDGLKRVQSEKLKPGMQILLRPER